MWKLTDYDYEMPDLDSFSFAINGDETVVWDSLYVGGGTFSDKIDLSRNPKFYPFKADKYKLTVWVMSEQPGCPDFVQDRVGWRGEAFTDARYLDTTSHPGFKRAKWEKVLDRSEIL